MSERDTDMGNATREDEGLLAVDVGDSTALPRMAERDLEAAKLATRVHCAISWPEGPRCNNCSNPHPCPVYAWGESTLVEAGWTPSQIDALDSRTGAWS